MNIVSEFDNQCQLVARHIKERVAVLRKDQMSPTEVGVYLEISHCSRFNINRASFHEDLPLVLDELKRQGIVSFYMNVSEERSHAKYGEDGAVTGVVVETAEEFHVGIPLDFDRAYQRYITGGKVRLTVYVSKGVRFYTGKSDAEGGYAIKGVKQRLLVQALKNNKRLPLHDLAKLLKQEPSNALHTIQGFDASFKEKLGLGADLFVDDGGYGFNRADYDLKFTDA